jgi:hypothetical protein
MRTLMYRLPERIFLCKFKYLAQSLTLACGGGGGGEEVTAFVLWALSLHCAVNDSNRDRKKINKYLTANWCQI